MITALTSSARWSESRMATGQLTVDINARLDKLQKGLQKAEQQAKKTGKKIDKTMGGGGMKAAAAMAKVFAVMGAIEGATKGVAAATEAVRGIYAGLTGDAEEFQRAIDKSVQSMKSLPFGIGGVVQGIEDMIMAIGGYNASMAEAERIMADGKLQKGFHDQTMQIVRTNATLEEQKAILLEQDPIQKQRLKTESQINAITREANATLEKMRENEEMSSDTKRFRYRQMKEEHALQIEMLRIEQKQFEEEQERLAAEALAQGILDAMMRASETAKEAADLKAKQIEEERKRAAEKRKQQEEELAKKRKEEIDQLKEANAMEEERLGKINSRLGLMATEGAPAKSGFTQTGSTAMGGFTFAESGAKDVMASLTKEAKDIQSRIDGTAKRIEEILKQLATKIGFA